jgi:uncharacterized membrane protein (DUF4010 family)
LAELEYHVTCTDKLEENSCELLAASIIIGAKQDGETSVLKLKSPLDCRGVFSLSIFLAVILAAVSMAKLFFGNYGSLALSFVTGLFELQGISLANATMFTQGGLTIEIASIGIILAVLASLFIKVFFSWVITRNNYTRVLSAIFLAMSIAIVLVTWLSL